MMKTIKKTGWMAILLLAGCFLTLPLFAQEKKEEGGAGEGGKPAPKDKTFLEVIEEGGVVMWLLIPMSVCVMALTAEGLVKYRVGKMAPPLLQAKLREAIDAGNYQDAWQLCQDNRCFLSTVLSAGLERIGRSKDSVDFAMQEAAVTEGTMLKVSATYLSVIGVVSPMVGLTGTVIGMIKAFSTLGSSGISDPAALAANIGEVLVATATGLIVAIPAFIFFYVLKAQAQKAVMQTEVVANRLMENIPYDTLQGITIGEAAVEAVA